MTVEQSSATIQHWLASHPITDLKASQNSSLGDLEHRRDPVWDIAASPTGNAPFSQQQIGLFLYVRNLCRLGFNAIEGKDACKAKNWSTKENDPDRPLNGGGTMTVIRADRLEKSAVNLSCVWGPAYPAIEGEYAGKPFAAIGVSLISHPRNPHAPIMHLNVRCLRVFDGESSITWLGGGADLTPMIEYPEDTALFHTAMRTACERTPRVGDYEKYKKWADDYFYIPHRKEPRGVGGIFFDFVKTENPEDFSLLLDVGQYAMRAYAEILSRRADTPYDQELLEKHLYWRGRYAEFNLVYDRGTRFGLMTGGHYEAIFCSLPPSVKW